jgi:hypothetical protein
MHAIYIALSGKQSQNTLKFKEILFIIYIKLQYVASVCSERAFRRISLYCLYRY